MNVDNRQADGNVLMCYNKKNANVYKKKYKNKMYQKY